MLAALLSICSPFCAQGQVPTSWGPQHTPSMIPRDSDLYLQMQFYTAGQRMLRESEAQDRKLNQEEQKLVDSGSLSALDFRAPARAVRDFNTAIQLLKQGSSADAIARLNRAIKAYPDFVSAHSLLAATYEDLTDATHARAEFETAAKLDPKFVDAQVALGRMDLAEQNLAAAQARFETAAAIQPADPGVLTMLCYTQHGTGQFARAIDTAARVHDVDHKGLPNAHYIAAASAMSLQDVATAKRQFELFVQEDPANPLAPQARLNLDVLNQNSAASAAAKPAATEQGAADSERLRSQLASLREPSDSGNGVDAAATSRTPSDAASPAGVTAPSSGFTFRSSVEEVAVFFVVTSRGRTVTDLEVSDVSLLDAGRSPERIVQFTPQSKLPLHLGLLIDTSGSVRERFPFEKDVASKFVSKMLGNPGDLAFVAGFSGTTNVTQDFTANYEELAAGIQKLENGGGTALFDAISLASWKLAAYPERGRVANVLVVVTDGEDNYSRTSLKQAIRDAEGAGVTVYTISTAEHGPRTAADRVLMEFAERTGGEAIFPGTMLGLGHSFDELRDIIRSRYLLAYRPANFVPDGSYHPISITAGKGSRRFDVHARKGYFARRVAGAAPPTTP